MQELFGKVLDIWREVISGMAPEQKTASLFTVSGGVFMLFAGLVNYQAVKTSPVAAQPVSETEFPSNMVPEDKEKDNQ